jgi:hypothetical protein
VPDALVETGAAADVVIGPGVVLLVGSGVVLLLVGSGVVLLLVVGGARVAVVLVLAAMAAVVDPAGARTHWGGLSRNAKPGRLHSHTEIQPGLRNCGSNGSSALVSLFKAVKVPPLPIVYETVQLLTKTENIFLLVSEVSKISCPEGMNANPVMKPPTKSYEFATTVCTYIVVRFKVVSLRSET